MSLGRLFLIYIKMRFKERRFPFFSLSLFFFHQDNISRDTLAPTSNRDDNRLSGKLTRIPAKCGPKGVRCSMSLFSKTQSMILIPHNVI